MRDRGLGMYMVADLGRQFLSVNLKAGFCLRPCFSYNFIFVSLTSLPNPPQKRQRKRLANCRCFSTRPHKMKERNASPAASHFFFGRLAGSKKPTPDATVDAEDGFEPMESVLNHSMFSELRAPDFG